MDTIQHDGLQAVFSRTGGILCSLTYNGENVLYPYTELPDGKTRGGCFVCFPFGRTTLNPDRRHGLLRHTDATEVIKDGANSIRFIFRDEGRQLYTAPGEYEIHAYMKSRIFCMEFSVRFHGFTKTEPLIPVLPAFHPYFVAVSNNVAVIDHILYTAFSSKGEMVPLQGCAAVKINSRHRIFMALETEPEHENTECGIYLWSDAPEKYFCAEPMAGSKERFNMSGGLFLTKEHPYLKFSMKLVLL